MALKPKSEAEELQVISIDRGMVEISVVGTKPLIFNRMAEKAKRDLLLGSRKKTEADKAANLKHNPIEEYRASVYRNHSDEAPTRLCLPAPAFKGAMCTAALRMPGTKKTEIAQLTWVDSLSVDLYGVPQLFMSVVRSADMAKTPDIRTRAIVPQWACTVRIEFVEPQLTAKAIFNLMAAAGLVSGVGDFRQEKGKGSFGQFRICDRTDAEFLHIRKTGGREAQDDALLNYTCYDMESQELLDFFSAEIVRLGREKQAKAISQPGADDDAKPRRRRAKAEDEVEAA